MEIGQWKGDVILMQQRQRNKGTQTGYMGLIGREAVLCVGIHYSRFLQSTC